MRKTSKKISLGFIALILVLLAVSPAMGEWIWSPELKGFINPRRVVMETPELQLGYAMQLFEERRYDRSIKEYTRFLEAYHDSDLGDRAQFGIAESFENMGKIERASEEYFKVIANYSDSQLFDDVLRKEYEIADSFFQEGERGKRWWNLFRDNGYESARQVYEQIVKNQPFSPRSSPYQTAEAEFRIGLSHYAQKHYLEAELQFQRVWEQYRNTQWGQEAFRGLADVLYLSASPVGYNQSHTQKAEQAYKDFLVYFPNHERRGEAEQRVMELREKQAQNEYEVGRFYEKRLQFDAAILTYRKLIRNFPDTTWGAQAGQRIENLKN